jgi:hypothetical protein
MRGSTFLAFLCDGWRYHKRGLLVPIMITVFSLPVSGVCQENADKVKRRYLDFVEQQIQRAVYVQLSSPALVRADAISQFIDLSPQDHQRLLLACKGAASAVAEKFRVPVSVLNRVPWERHEKFILNRREVHFPNSFQRVESKLAVPPATVVVAALATSIRVNLNYERTGVGTGGSGGINSVLNHEIFTNTLNKLTGPQQIADFEVHRTVQMQNAMSDFLMAILGTQLTLNDDQRKLVRKWYFDQLDDVAANPDNPIGQNTSFALKRLDDQALKEILTVDQWVIWRTNRTMLEQRRW